MANGRTSLGIAATNGVVIATDKKLASALVDTKEVSKIEGITQQSGFVYSGLGPDYRVLVRKSRKDAQKYGRLYGEEQPVSLNLCVCVCVCVYDLVGILVFGLDFGNFRVEKLFFGLFGLE